MKRLQYILFCLVFGISGLTAQQIPYKSQFTKNAFLYNPAQTGEYDIFQASGFARQQWIGFEGAPFTAFASAELPLPDFNMNVGGAIIIDKTGPTSRNGIYLSYSYELNELFGYDDKLSFGASANISQYNFNPNGEVFRDQGDPNIFSSKDATFYPSVGVGVFYLSNTEMYDDNAFYAGFALNQAYSTQVLIQDANFERKMHLYGSVGMKLFNYDYFIEPNISIMYTGPEFIDVLLNVNFEMEERFWAGIGYSSAQDISIQGGLIIPEILDRYSRLRIGALANMGVGSGISNFGPGFEFIVAYEYDL